MIEWAYPRWRGFVVWLTSEWPQRTPAPAWLPGEVGWGKPPLGRALALARPGAKRLNKWLVDCLEAALRQQLDGQPLGVPLAAFQILPVEVQPCLWGAAALRAEPERLVSRLEADLARVLRLAGARTQSERQGWLKLEVYSWAQVFALARAWQVYTALEARHGPEAADALLAASLARLKARLLGPQAARAA